MIITDLMEYVGKNIKIYFDNGDKPVSGKLEYIQSYCEMNGWRKPKHFYITTPDGDYCFRAWHVKKVELLEGE